MRAQLKLCLLHSSISTQKQSTHLELKRGLTAWYLWHPLGSVSSDKI